MALVNVDFDGIRLSDAEADTIGNDIWDKWGSGQSPNQETTYKYQGLICQSEAIPPSPQTSGIEFQAGDVGPTDLTDRTVLLKMICTTPGLIQPQGANGLKAQIGSTDDASNFYEYYVIGGDTYPTRGSWLIVPIDPNVSGWRDVTNGTPALSAADYYSVYGQATANPGYENFAMDAIDILDNGTGLTLGGGDGADVDGTFQDFVDDDEGTQNNRWGVVSTIEGIIYVAGVLTIGTPSSAAGFTDINKVLIFPDGRFAVGFCGIDLGLQDSNTDISLTACTLVGRGGNTSAADTRPDFGVSGTGGDAIVDSCSVQNFNEIVLTIGVVLIDSTFIECQKLVQDDASITSCVFDSSPVPSGTGFMEVVDLNDIVDCSFISGGSGHALTIVPGASGTYNFNGNTFTAYGVSGSQNAAIYNNSGGLVTLNIGGGGDSPTIRNGIGSTTVVINARTLTLTQLVSASEVRIYTAGTQTELDGIEDSSTSFAYTYDFNLAGTDVDIVIHHVEYEYLRFDNFELATTDAALPISQQFDRNYDNPPGGP